MKSKYAVFLLITTILFSFYNVLLIIVLEKLGSGAIYFAMHFVFDK